MAKRVHVTPNLGVRYMGVSKNSGTPKSSILIGFSIINHPFWDTSIFGNTHMQSFIGSQQAVILSGQIITTSAEVTLNGGLVRESP